MTEMPIDPQIHIYINQEPKMTMTADIPTAQHVTGSGQSIQLFEPYVRTESFRARKIIVPIEFLTDGGLRVVNLDEEDTSPLIGGYRIEARWLQSTVDSFSPYQREQLIKALAKAAIFNAKSKDDAQQRVQEADKRHHDDIAKIGAKLIEEAESRRWCNDYDDIVNEMNETLSVPLPLRMKTYDVEVELRYRVTIQVEASSEDDAETKVRDDWSLAYDDDDFSRSDVNELDVRSTEEA